MKKNILLPHSFMKIGLFMIIPFLVMACFGLADKAPVIEIPMPYLLNDLFTPTKWFGIFEKEDVYMEIWMIGLFLSLLFIALSKEQVEDEMLMKIRLESMLFALWGTSIWFILETLFIFGTFYAYCLWATLYIYLIFFILKFRYELYKLKKMEK